MRVLKFAFAIIVTAVSAISALAEGEFSIVCKSCFEGRIMQKNGYHGPFVGNRVGSNCEKGLPEKIEYTFFPSQKPDEKDGYWKIGSYYDGYKALILHPTKLFIGDKAIEIPENLGDGRTKKISINRISGTYEAYESAYGYQANWKGQCEGRELVLPKPEPKRKF